MRARNGLYAHLCQDGQASSLRPGVLTPDPLPGRVLKNMDENSKVRHRKMRKSFLSDLTRLTLLLDQGFNAYLRYFREGSAQEQLDLTRLGALFVGRDDPGSSTFPPP
jgi:hypothetical protein